MFEKWRIKEHMEVVDASGRHLGTVDEIDGDNIKLTRSDSSDGQHHYVEIDHVDDISDNRVTLKAEATVSGGTQAAAPSVGTAPASDGAHPGTGATDTGYAGSTTTSAPATREDAPLFGTSGRGTGMGGSGLS